MTLGVLSASIIVVEKLLDYFIAALRMWPEENLTIIVTGISYHKEKPESAQCLQHGL